MGFMDKLKDAAKNAKEQAGKFADQVKVANELQKMVTFGSIKGESIVIPGTAIGTESVYYSVDDVNDKLLIIRYIDGKAHSLLKEYDMDDVVEFKHNRTEAKELNNMTLYGYYNNIILSSGEVFETYNQIFIRNDKNDATITLEKKDRNKIILGAVHFLSKIKDNETKQYVNQLYIDNGESVVFDENGEIIGQNIRKYMSKFNKGM